MGGPSFARRNLFAEKKSWANLLGQEHIEEVRGILCLAEQVRKLLAKRAGDELSGDR